MAQKFSTSGAQTASVLLRTIPEAQQVVIAKELTANLRTSFDDAAASVAVELIAGRDDINLQDDFLDVLKSRIQHGSPDNVALLISSFPNLSDRLVAIAADYLADADKLGTIQLPNDHTLEPKGEANEVDDFDSDGQRAVSFAALQWLHFAKAAIPVGRASEHEDSLFNSALKHLHDASRSTALAARDLVFSLLSSAAAQRNLEAVRSTISSLIPARDAKLQQTLGYALWMRLLAASDSIDMSSIDLADESYWNPLLHGLRNGDAERRKMCLDILKRSVALAIEQEKIGTVSRYEKATSKIVSYQYSRYCAVFETLVLARYTNLVVECERDLNLLASKDSIVQPRWLYVLLATALDPTTTDQNRKFIGDWILRSELFSSRFPEGIAAFVSHSFLPWAMEGHLFVSSTRLHNGHTLSSRHGDRLSTFICNLLGQTPSELQPTLLDAMFDFLMRKHATLFAYSAVHLIRGISQAFETCDTLSLTQQQVEHLLFISALRTLPEVATDYLVVQCWRICSLSDGHSKQSLADEVSEIGRIRLQELEASAEYVKQSMSPAHRGASPTKSQRDVKIQTSVEKCKIMSQQVAQGAPQSREQLQYVLEDIWSDVEYLEYPRALLIQLPAVFFNPTVFQAALQEDADNEAGLRDLVAATLPRILDLAQRRSFLLAPIMASLREVIASVPEAASVLDLEECILRVCQTPPEPSIDLRMEYSTVPLLAGLLDVSPNICRDQYFGQGEGYGFAAYLDLISRIGSHQPELIQSLLEKLLARWKKQKIPTPTISAWKTTLQLEVLLLCFEQHASNPATTKAALDSMIKDLYYILSLEPLPRFRYLMEWTLVRIQIRYPELRSQTLDMLSTKDHQSNPKFLASLMKMGVMLATAESGTEEFANDLAIIFIALSSSSKIIIRHEAQWAFPKLMDHARSQQWTKVVSSPAYVSLDEYIRSLPRFDDPPAERVMSKIDPVADHTMTNLVEGLWTDLDYTRPPYTTHQDFVDLYANDAKLNTTSWPASCMPLGPPIPKPPRPTTLTDDDPSTKSLLGPKQMTQDEAIALQTKGTAYLKTSLDDSNEQANKHSLLLVASLIENPYNLGGLSRVSEIFGAQAMYVRDPRIIAEKDFTSVAVSSHNHVDIMPLPVPDISAWVAEKKSEGWTVVGIEQTDRSVLLGEANAVLPEKTILVLGSEREGMPAAVLGECDLLVEIPQVGVTRSLNVQTAAAIVLFEYGRQHQKEK